MQGHFFDLAATHGLSEQLFIRSTRAQVEKTIQVLRGNKKKKPSR